MMTASRIHIALAALMGASGTTLWAAASHGGMAAAAIGAQFLLIHAAAVLALTALRKQGLIQNSLASLSAAMLILGTAIFAGDLALRAYAGNRLFPMAAPLGGGLMILGWLLLAVSALMPGRK